MLHVAKGAGEAGQRPHDRAAPTATSAGALLSQPAYLVAHGLPTTAHSLGKVPVGDGC